MIAGTMLAVPPRRALPPPAFVAIAHPARAPETKSADAPPLSACFEVGRAASIRIVCQAVRQLVCEMVSIASHRLPLRTCRRRTGLHARQIAMYVCHVALCIPLGDIALAFGRDRSTVAYNCGVVEDRRDDAAFDDFVAAIERIVVSVFSPAGAAGHA